MLANSLYCVVHCCQVDVVVFGSTQYLQVDAVVFVFSTLRGIYVVADRMTIDDVFFNVQNEW